MTGRCGRQGEPCGRGHTLLELVVASSLLAATLVPALGILRGALEQSRRIEIQELLTTCATAKLEEHLGLAAAAWQETTVVGDFSADGSPQVRFRAVRSATALDGGIPDRLMAVTVTVWQDLDADATLDAGEPRVVMASKAPKMALYRTEAGY